MTLSLIASRTARLNLDLLDLLVATAVAMAALEVLLTAVTSTLATAADLEDLASVALPAAVLLVDRSTLPTYVDFFSRFLHTRILNANQNSCHSTLAGKT